MWRERRLASLTKTGGKLHDAGQLKSREKEQGKERGGQQLSIIAAEINHQQGVGVRGVAGGREKRRISRQHATRKSKCGKTGECLYQNDEGQRHVIPRNEKAQRGGQQPRDRRVENEARLAENVISPLCPARIDNSLLPLLGNVEPGGGVELEIVAGSGAAPKEGGDDQQRNTEREAEREEPAAKRGAERVVGRVGGGRHSAFTGV